MAQGAELTWMRQPHYYIGLYSYTYSAGLANRNCRFSKIKTKEANQLLMLG